MGLVQRVQRPDAPYELSDAEAEIWQRIVADLPADWFTPKNMDLLVQNCRHVASSNRIARMMEDMIKVPGPICLKQYDALAAMQERETRCITSLMTKMRTSQQSLVENKRKLDAFKVNKPWDKT
jgi:hypothetical protein